MAKLDQGPLGHERRKPTTLLTNQVEVMALHGVAGPADQTGRSGTVEDRIKEWAPKLKEAIKAGLQRVNRETLEEVRVKAARGPTRDEQWRTHVENKHVPHRRDCRVCMEAAGRAGGDILGPTREGGDQDCAKAKYAVVTVLTLPVKKSSGEPLVMLGEEEEEMDGAGEVGLGLHPEGGELPRGPEELLVEEEDLFAEQEERDPAPGEEGRVEVEKAEEETRKWKEKIKDLEDVAVRNLTFAIPIRSRNGDVVLQAVAECYSRYRAAGLQVLRVPTDRVCAGHCYWRGGVIVGGNVGGEESLEDDLGGQCGGHQHHYDASVRVEVKASEVPGWEADGAH